MVTRHCHGHWPGARLHQTHCGTLHTVDCQCPWATLGSCCKRWFWQLHTPPPPHNNIMCTHAHTTPPHASGSLRAGRPCDEPFLLGTWKPKPLHVDIQVGKCVSAVCAGACCQWHCHCTTLAVEGAGAARGDFEATNAKTTHRTTPCMYLGSAPLGALALASSSRRLFDGRAREPAGGDVMREHTRHMYVHTTTHAVTP